LKNQVFVPTVAKFPNDILGSWRIQEPFVQASYQRGLMLVELGGIKAVTDEAGIQIKNLETLKDEYGDTPIVTMLSNTPFEEMDWLHNAALAANHVRCGIHFAAVIPIGGRKIVTFHLNSLVTEETFLSKSAEDWRELFDFRIAPMLKDVAQYAASNGVELKVETVPVPEYGDWTQENDLSYLGKKVRHLRNPFYLTTYWGFQQLRRLGLGICLDLCHNRTIYRAAGQLESHGIIFDDDKYMLSSPSHDLMTDVLGLLPTDLVHLNDGLGDFTQQGDVFKEGVPLGQGDIEDLREIINHLNHRKIPFVIEVDEGGDFKNRPGTKASIEYLLKQ